MLAFVLNGAQLHLLINHLPVIGLPIAMAAILYGLFRKSDAVLGFAMLLIVVAALGAGVAKWTGEEAEDIVEDSGLVVVSHDLIHDHEEAAEWAFYAAAVLGLMALAALVLGRKNKPMPRPLVLAVLVVGLGVSGYMGYTAHLGGLINHPEIQDGATGVPVLDDDDDSNRGRGRGRGGDDD